MTPFSSLTNYQGRQPNPERGAVGVEAAVTMLLLGPADQTRICVNEDPHVPDSTVCPSTGNPVASCTIVHVEVPYRPVLPLFSMFSVTLQAEALMRNETSP